MSGQGHHAQRSARPSRSDSADHGKPNINIPAAGLKGVPESLWRAECYGTASVARKKAAMKKVTNRNGDNMQDQKKLLMSAERVMVLVFAPLGSDAGR